SSSKEIGVVGEMEIVKSAYPDPTQFDATSEYFDAKSTLDQPRWLQIDVHFVQKTRLLSLSELRSFPELAQMVLLQKGSRLSITPVSAIDAAFILEKLC
ncbi:MAG: EVE domain-containing protein, partial [Burkholderiales bacterium]|nr:EVE domain-containing protein [Burkholderiales bacterium]